MNRSANLPRNPFNRTNGPRRLHSDAAHPRSAHAVADPYLRPAFPLGNRLRRMFWNLVWLLLYRPSPRPLHRWRALLLRLFGAHLGTHCHFYPKSKIWAPWNLICADQITVADEAEIYNPAPLTLGSHAILSQAAYMQRRPPTTTTTPAFPLLAFAMEIGAYAWVCARASIAPGVHLGEGSVLGLGSVATRDLDPWSVYAGTPAIKIRERERRA